MNKTYQYHPSGVRTMVPTGGLEDIAVSKDLVDMVSRVSMNPKLVDSVAFLKGCVELSKVLYGEDICEWFKDQKNNTKLTKHQHELINDTLLFIKSGKRVISVPTRSGLIEHDVCKVPKRDIDAIYTFGYGSLSSNLLSNWLSRPSGVYDFLHTTYHLFNTGPKSTQ